LTEDQLASLLNLLATSGRLIALTDEIEQLDPEACKELILRWQKKHNRRRNLWRDLNATGLQI
jgi:hypothetical protein